MRKRQTDERRRSGSNYGARLEEVVIGFGADIFPNADFNDVLIVSQDRVELEQRAAGDLPAISRALRQAIEALPAVQPSPPAEETGLSPRQMPSDDEARVSELDARPMAEWLRSRPDVHLPRGPAEEMPRLYAAVTGRDVYRVLRSEKQTRAGVMRAAALAVEGSDEFAGFVGSDEQGHVTKSTGAVAD